MEFYSSYRDYPDFVSSFHLADMAVVHPQNPYELIYCSQCKQFIHHDRFSRPCPNGKKTNIVDNSRTARIPVNKKKDKKQDGFEEVI